MQSLGRFDAVEALETENSNTASLEVSDLYSALLIRFDRGNEAEPFKIRLEAVGYEGDWGRGSN
jgi:hypothetical protein